LNENLQQDFTLRISCAYLDRALKPQSCQYALKVLLGGSSVLTLPTASIYGPKASLRTQGDELVDLQRVLTLSMSAHDFSIVWRTEMYGVLKVHSHSEMVMQTPNNPPGRYSLVRLLQTTTTNYAYFRSTVKGIRYVPPPPPPSPPM